MNKKILKIRIFLWLILAIFLSIFIYLKIVPSGRITYISDFSRPSYFIGKLTPQERVEINKTEAEIKGDPVYFSLKTPRRFEQAKVTVKFKNTSDFPIMEIGLLNDKVAWNYDLKPLQNKIIDQIALVWPVVDGPNGARLIEREKKYDMIEQFLSDFGKNPSLVDEIALYRYNLSINFLLDNYKPGAQEQKIHYSFRGSYQFYTYIKNEELNYVFNFLDLNKNKDNDPVDIKVYNQNGLIDTKHIADDDLASPERQASLKISNLPEGVYRLSFIANDDIVTQAIISKQSQFALINKVWLAEGNQGNIILFTNSRLISAQTINPGSLGKIKVGNDFLGLDSTYQRYSLKVIKQSNNLDNDGNGKLAPRAELLNSAKIELNKDDIIISGDGVFCFSQNCFDPRLKNIDGNLDIQKANINYILTSYESPQEAAGWQIASATFDLTRAYQENGKYQFLISVPGLGMGDRESGAISIKEIKINLQGRTLFEKIRKYFNK